MHEDHEKTRRDWRLPDAWWERIVPLLPPRKPHPLGGHRPRVEDRQAMDAMFFVLRPGCQWKALQETGICSSRAAHRRCQEWTEAGIFLALWQSSLVAYEALTGIDWAWLAMDGAMTKAPRGGETGGQASDRAREDRGPAQRPHRGRRRARQPRGGGGQAA